MLHREGTISQKELDEIKDKTGKYLTERLSRLSIKTIHRELELAAVSAFVGDFRTFQNLQV